MNMQQRVEETDRPADSPIDCCRLGARVLEMANRAMAIHMRERVEQALRESRLDALAMRHE